MCWRNNSYKLNSSYNLFAIISSASLKMSMPLAFSFLISLSRPYFLKNTEKICDFLEDMEVILANAEGCGEKVNKDLFCGAANPYDKL